MIVSIAIPCYKSQKTIEKVVADAREAILSRPGSDYQFILVNDYPGDGTFDVIRKMCADDPKIIGVDLTKNFGQTSAKMAALKYFTGDVLVYMDDDGQHPSEGIWLLVDKINEGYDIVYAYFKEKKHSIFKQITSNINGKLSEINGTRIKGVHTSSFNAYSRAAALALKEYQSPFPSMGGFLNSMFDKVTDVEMAQQVRLEGTSGYTLKKLMRLWLTGFTNFSVVPLRFIAFSGGIIALSGFVFGLFLFFRKLIVPNISAGYTSTMAVLLFMGGLILFALGFIGEYIGRIYMTISNMQQYRIREVINYDKDNKK